MQFDDYISRSVDGDCLRALRAGRNFYVFGPPQTGKSRLRRRIADTLRANGLRVIEIDLAARGGGELYFDLAMACAVQFGLGDPSAFWDRFCDLEPAERWQRFLQSAPAGGPVILLIDSVEALLAGGHDVEAFFGALRPARLVGQTPVVTCLFGALQRVDLGVDIRTASLGQSAARAWFRTAVQLRPDPFTEIEVEAAMHRLEAPGGQARALLSAIMDWTAGHPALTVGLIDAIADGGPLMISGSEADTVAATVDALYLEPDPKSVPVLAAAEAWSDCGDPAAVARWWSRIRRAEPVDWRPGDESHRQLRMAGLARVDGAVLRPTNRVFIEAFDEAWCDARTLAHGLSARARAWVASGEDEGYLLEGDLLRRASAWAEGREVEAALSDLLVASWVHARHSERPMAVAPERLDAVSMPPASMNETAPPGLIVAEASTAPPAARPPAVVEVAAAQAPAPAAPPTAPMAPTAPGTTRWLAVAVAVMAMVTAALLAALWQSRGTVDGAIAALTGARETAPRATPGASTVAGQAAAPSSEAVGEGDRSAMERVAALEAAVARTELRLAALEGHLPTTTPVAPAAASAVAASARPPSTGDELGRPSAARSPAVAVESDAALTARAIAAEQAAVAARAEKRAAEKRAAEERADRQAAEQRAERRAAEKKRRAAEKKRRAAERREALAAARRAEKRAAERAEKRRAERRAAEARIASRQAAHDRLEAARRAADDRPGPVAPPSPRNAIAQQAPSYRRSLTRCKRYDLPHRVKLDLTVEPDGRVARAAVAEGSAERVDHGCLVESARRFRFAPFAGPAITAAVDYRL